MTNTTIRDPNLTRSGKPRCEEHVTPTGRGVWRSRRCDHPATITIDDKNLCGVHARSLISRKQQTQRWNLTSAAQRLIDAQRDRARQRQAVGIELVDAIDNDDNPVPAVDSAREELRAIDEQFVASLRECVEWVTRALKTNAVAEYPLADDEQVVVNATYVRRHAEAELERREG